MNEGPSPRQSARSRRRALVAAVSAVAITVVFIISAINLAVVHAAAGSLPAGSHAAPTNATSSCPRLKLPTPICHVFIIYLENQNISWVLKHGQFQKYLAGKYALASQYYSVYHFSYPNYVAGTSGFLTNYIHLMNKSNIVDLIRNTSYGMTWRAYLEDMPAPCDQTPTPNYKIAHNPFVWYADIWNNKALCRPHDVNFTGYYADINSTHLPNYVYIGPNSTHSCWKGGMPVCDPWLRTLVSPMVNSSYFNSSVILITYDEGITADLSGINGTKGGGHIYTVAVSPYACPGYISTTQYNHYNLLTTSEWLLGLGRTGNNDNWTQHPPMYDLFCFPNGTGGGHGAVIGMSPALPASDIAQAMVNVRESVDGDSC